MEINLKKLPKKYKKVPVDSVFSKLIRCKVDFYYKSGSDCTELIYDNSHRIYASRNSNFPYNLIYLFNVVKNDCEKFLMENPIIDIPPIVPVTKYNYKYDHNRGVITGTDLNHAFWRIAYVKNYISKKTYDRGLNEKAKALRLATISVLGREKRYDKYIGGVLTESVVLKEKNEQLQSIYKDVRQSCYYMMHELSLLLGEDFDCWRTDCIYYRDSPKNRAIVHRYFEEREMLFKQLSFNTVPKEAVEAKDVF